MSHSSAAASAPRPNRFKATLAAGRPALAMWLTTPWSAVPEIVGRAGLDAAFIDLEHVSHGIDEAERLIIACEAAGMSPLIRPARIDPSDISRLLDAGAHGIVFPQVESLEDAELAVRCTRYRPEGLRGWGGAHTRLAGWRGGYAADLFAGARSDPGVYTDEYVRMAHDHAAVVLIVETTRGIERIEEIATVEGVDAIVFGWGDYAVEAGFDREACRHAASAVYATAQKRGIGVALSPGDAFYPGCFILAGVDSLHMSAALVAAVEAARKAFPFGVEA